MTQLCFNKSFTVKSWTWIFPISFLKSRSVFCPLDWVVFYLRLENPDSSLNWFYLTQYNPQYLKSRLPDTTLSLNPSIGVTGPLGAGDSRPPAPAIGAKRAEMATAGCCWLSLVNYHHHLFYIREPFVTKKGILTVCLMGETFKLERQYIYQRPVRASGAGRLTSKIWVSLVSVGGQIYLHTSLTRKLRRQQLPSVFCSKVTGHRYIFLTGRQKKNFSCSNLVNFFPSKLCVKLTTWEEGEAIRRN